MKLHIFRIGACAASLLFIANFTFAEAKLAPKYAADVIPLSKDHEFFKNNPAISIAEVSRPPELLRKSRISPLYSFSCALVKSCSSWRAELSVNMLSER